MTRLRYQNLDPKGKEPPSRRQVDNHNQDSTSEDEDQEQLGESCKRRRPALRSLTQRVSVRLVSDIVLFLLAIFGIMMLVSPTATCSISAPPPPAIQRPTPDPGRNPTICDCGSSIAEAQSRGCKYDELALAWLPDRCRDESLRVQFVVAGDGPGGRWLHWRYQNKTGLLTDEQVAAFADSPGGRLYSPAKWFVAQCIFYWRKQIRAPVSGVIVEPRYNDIGYILKCADVFMKGEYGDLMVQSEVSLHSSRP